uniref:Alpha/beta hydrolase fold-3 domain-containing protein n=1 Tax=Quercus lobata TaxID=97700 RepID=A0A7N2N5I5_QUELO
MNNDFCSNMALQLAVVVVSVEYRLAPEHRLPAAYDDAIEALHWIKSYQVGLRASTSVDDFKPLKIKGLVLHHPFLGGSQRTKSKLRLVNNPVLP